MNNATRVTGMLRLMLITINHNDIIACNSTQTIYMDKIGIVFQLFSIQVFIQQIIVHIKSNDPGFPKFCKSVNKTKIYL